MTSFRVEVYPVFKVSPILEVFANYLNSLFNPRFQVLNCFQTSSQFENVFRTEERWNMNWWSEKRVGFNPCEFSHALTIITILPLGTTNCNSFWKFQNKFYWKLLLRLKTLMFFKTRIQLSYLENVKEVPTLRRKFEEDFMS